METSGQASPTPDEAAAALRDAEEHRDRLAHALVLPPYFYVYLGAAVAVQIGTAALGIAVYETWARVATAAGLLVFGVVAVLELVRFRRRNAVWLGGLAGRVVLGSSPTAVVAYAVALAGGVAAAFAHAWWLVVACAIAGGTGYAFSGLRWTRAYRHDPARHGRGDSIWLLAALAVPAVGGLVLLVAER